MACILRTREFEIAKRHWSNPYQSGCDKVSSRARYCGYGFGWQEPEKTVNLKDLA